MSRSVDTDRGCGASARRGRVAALVLLAALVAGSGPFGAGAARAQEPVPSEDSSVEPGDVLVSGGDILASVEGQVLTVAPFAGGLALGVKMGTSGARLRGTTATATSSTMDLGLLGDLGLLAIATAPTLNRLGIDTSGAPAFVPLPRAVTADSRDNPTVDHRVLVDAVQLGPVTAGGGHETASAPEGGPAVSRTELGDLRIDLGIGELVLAGGVAETRASATEVSGHVSFGQMRFDVGIATAADLRGLEWSVHQVLGEPMSASFAVGSATLAGVRQASPGLEMLEAVTSAINSALVPVGMTIELPAATDEGVSPLRIMLKDSPMAFEYLNPVYSVALAGVINQAEEALVGGVPETGLAVTVANVLLAALTGRGGALVDIGGLTGSIMTTPIEQFSYDPVDRAVGTYLPPGQSTLPTETEFTPVETDTPVPPPIRSDRAAPIASLGAGPRTVSVVVAEDLPGAIVLALGGLAILAAWLVDRRRIGDWAARR